MGGNILDETHVCNSATKAVVAKCTSKYEGRYEIIESIGSNLKIEKKMVKFMYLMWIKSEFTKIEKSTQI